MTVLDTNVVDIVGVTEDAVTLVISDHLEWKDKDNQHMYDLQEKVNTYLRFYEGGELYEHYPNAKGKKVQFEVAFKYEPNHDAKWFLKKLEEVLLGAGVTLITTVVD